MAESPKATERQARTPLPPKQDGPQKESPFKRPRMQILLLVLGLLAANYLFVAIFAPGGPEPVRIPYSPTFLEQVRAGNVERVSTQGETVDGKFKKEFKYQDAEPTKNFDTEIPTFALASDDLNKLLEEKGVIIEAEPVNQSRGILASLILGFGPVILLIGLFVFLARRAGGGGAMGALGNFGRSRARRVEGGEQKVTFKDVAGIDESKAELTEIVDFLKNPEKYQKLGGRIPRGVLLSGRPGTGKTLLARAVAGEAEAPFFSISASEFVEAIVGIGASRVRDLFKQAKEAAPAIIFIDELDAIGRSRTTGASFGGGNDEREQTLNQILTEMDGFESDVAVIVLGATNRPEILDAALLRPGRFDRRIAVPPPDREGRAQILAVHTRSLPLDGDVSLDQLAATTPGMVGADLANLANEAALTAARRGHEKVEMSDFTDAMEKIVLGSPRGTVLSDDERRRVAYHEAGHALVGMLTPGADPVRKVSIIPRGQALGVTFAAPDDDRSNYEEAWLLAKIDVALGGRVAEEVVFGTITTGAESDIQQLTQIARGMVGRWGMSRDIGPIAVLPQEGNGMLLPGADQPSETTQRRVDDEVRRIVEEAHARVTRLLTERREQLDALTNALLADETLDEDAAYRAAQVTRGAADMSPEERNFPADARL
ncbi:MAG: ATP-dependent zinc metalloprotease FtsH [Solirubrobacteraceae bacterium]